MSPKTVHILHLTDLWLRWATLGQEPHGFTLESKGEIMSEGPGQSIRCLDEWIDKKMEHPGEVYLYDGRPMYFSFATRLPRKAAGQIEGAVRLKIRQELGLAEDAVVWTTWPEGKAHVSGQAGFSTVVTRRESIQDLLDWQRRHQVEPLWVGADVCAVTALLHAGNLLPPVLVLNACDYGATLFYSENGEPMSKARTSLTGDRESQDDAWLVGLAEGKRARADFGREDISHVLKAYPSLANLPAVPVTDLARIGKGKRLASLAPELFRFDAVILGAIVQLDSGHELMDSLLREANAKPILAALGQMTNMRRRVLALSALSLALVLSLWFIHAQRGSAREKLDARVEKLKPAIQLTEAREDVLQRIRADRAAAMTPLFEAIHQAAPPGLALQSITLGATGLVKIQGMAQGSEMANNFFKAVSDRREFEPRSVQLQEVKQVDPQKASFQLTARIKGRTKR